MIDDEELRLAMKDAGLGTPQRAPPLSKRYSRASIRDKKALVATPKGLALVSTLNSPLLTSAELTGQWEQKLARMARNAYACETFMGEVRGMVDTLVAQIACSAGAATTWRRPPQDSGAATCRVPRLPEVPGGGGAGGFLSERAGAKGTFLVCSTGKDRCGFLTDKPKNARQRKAWRPGAPSARGDAATPASRERQPLLSCCAYPHCQGVRWFNGKGHPGEGAEST